MIKFDIPDHRPAAELIRQHAGELSPRLALVLGSGLGGLAERMDNPVVVDYQSLPGFPQPSVAGHAGRLLIGELFGVPVFCLQGRAHYYEGRGLSGLTVMVRALQAAGAEGLLLNSASGSLRPKVPPGTLMLVEDHINWAGVNPLIGPNDEQLGPRFLDLSQAYDPELRACLAVAAEQVGVPLPGGVYLMVSGPSFETPAEIRAFARLGADAVGMSLVPECLLARHCGLRVAALAAITNLAAGLSGGPLSHAETLSQGASLADTLETLLANALVPMHRCLAGSDP